MSDEEKIIPVGAQSRSRPPLRGWRLAVFIAVFLVVLLIACLVAFPQWFNLDRVQRYFRYLGKSDDEYSISFEANSTNAYAAFGSNLAVGTEGGLYLYDLNGQQQAMVQGSLPNPTVCTSKELALCYGTGNSYLATVSKSGKTVLSRTVSGTLLDADLSEDGWICYAAAESGYKSVVTVLDDGQNETYKWYSSTRYISNCAVSQGGGYLAVVGLGEENGAFRSTLTVLKTDSEEPVGEADLGNQMLYDLQFLGKDRICAIGQDQILFLNCQGEVSAEYPLDNVYLSAYGFSRDGYVVLAINAAKAGNKFSLVTLDADGSQIAELYLGREVRCLSVCDGYTGVLTDESLTVYSKNLEAYAQTSELGTTNQILMRYDGTVFRIGSGQADLYIP